LQRQYAESRDEEQTPPWQRRVTVQDQEGAYEENDVYRQPNSLRDQWAKVRKGQYRQGTKGRIRHKADKGLIEVEVVLFSLKPFPLIDPTEWNSFAIKRSGDVVVREVRIQRSPSWQKAGYGKGHDQCDGKNPFCETCELGAVRLLRSDGDARRYRNGWLKWQGWFDLRCQILSAWRFADVS
jgi:hypothetical protein